MTVDLQVREEIALFLLGKIDAAELEAWLAEVTWDIDDEPASVRRVAFGALRLVTETANGDWGQNELQEKLAALLQTVSPVASASWKGEEFLDKLTEAEKKARERQTDETHEIALMGYAASSTEESFGSWQSSDRGFLHQPKGESDTPHQAPTELAIG